MAISNANFSVTSTPQIVAQVPRGRSSASKPSTVILSGASAICYVGTTGVNATTGTAIAATSGILEVTLAPGDILYIMTATTATIKVLRTGSATA